MEKEKCFCPFCNADITDFMHDRIVLYNRRRQIATAKGRITKEKREEMTRASQARLHKWQLEHPEETRRKAAAASRTRTADSFARQARTIRETLHRKSVKFAKLLYEARSKGVVITPDLEVELLERARQIVKDENRVQRIARKKAAAKKKK